MQLLLFHSVIRVRMHEDVCMQSAAAHTAGCSLDCLCQARTQHITHLVSVVGLKARWFWSGGNTNKRAQRQKRLGLKCPCSRFALICLPACPKLNVYSALGCLINDQSTSLCQYMSSTLLHPIHHFAAFVFRGKTATLAFLIRHTGQHERCCLLDRLQARLHL